MGKGGGIAAGGIGGGCGVGGSVGVLCGSVDVVGVVVALSRFTRPEIF